eukprot:13619058-Alexandrium_andersonii.AAC.1
MSSSSPVGDAEGGSGISHEWHGMDTVGRQSPLRAAWTFRSPALEIRTCTTTHARAHTHTHAQKYVHMQAPELPSPKQCVR